MKKELKFVPILVAIVGVTACGTLTSSQEETSSENVVSSSELETETTQESTEETTDVSLEESTEEVPTDELVTTIPLSLKNNQRQEWEDRILLCDITWQNVLLGEEEQITFPKLQETLTEFNLSNDSYANEMMEWLLPEAKLALEEQAGYFYGYTSDTSLYVQRADSNLVSIRIDYDSFTGGVHPMYSVGAWNVNPVTGTKLELDDVLVNMDGISDLLINQLMTKYDYLDVDYVSETLQSYAPSDFTWTLGYENITFYFSPYEIAPYAAGLLTMTLWFDEYPDLVVETYQNIPEDGYTMQIPFLNDIEIDLDSTDGTRDVLFLVTMPDESGAKNLKLTLNRTLFLDENCQAHEIIPYLSCVQEGNAKNYVLYVECKSDNGDSTWYVYGCNQDGFYKMEE